MYSFCVENMDRLVENRLRLLKFFTHKEPINSDDQLSAGKLKDLGQILRIPVDCSVLKFSKIPKEFILEIS